MNINTGAARPQSFGRLGSDCSGNKSFVFRTAAEIGAMAEEEIAWVAKPYVARGVITDVEGKAKDAGKTTFLLAMIRSVVSGDRFLGQETQSTPAVLLTEERPTSVRAGLRRAGLLERQDLHILHWHETKGAELHGVIQAAIEKCKEVRAKLLVIDTINQFARFRDEDENHSGPVFAAMEPLQEAANQGLAVVMGRHARKSGGRVGDSGRGSSAFTGTADIVLSLRRPEGQSKSTLREIHALSRFEATPELLVIDFTGEGYVAVGTQADVVRQQTKAAVVTVLTSANHGGVTLDELLGRLPIELNGRTTAQGVLDELMTCQSVARLGRGVKGSPFRYQSLDPPEPPA